MRSALVSTVIFNTSSASFFLFFLFDCMGNFMVKSGQFASPCNWNAKRCHFSTNENHEESSSRRLWFHVGFAVEMMNNLSKSTPPATACIYHVLPCITKTIHRYRHPAFETAKIRCDFHSTHLITACYPTLPTCVLYFSARPTAKSIVSRLQPQSDAKWYKW